jgi:hypothetical protein
MRFSVPLKLVDAAMTTGVMEMSALFASVASGVQGRPDDSDRIGCVYV